MKISPWVFSGCDRTQHTNHHSSDPPLPRINKVGKEEAEVGIQAAEVKAVQADAQADLDVALPALEAALKALDSLTKNDITEVKGFAKPPPAVQIVMEAVCILLEVGDERLMNEAPLLFAKNKHVTYSLVSFCFDQIVFDLSSTFDNV